MNLYPKSTALWEKAVGLTPGGTHTNGKRVTTFHQPGAFPAFATHGRGARLFDVDGREYIDYIAALGPIVLGYDEPRIRARIERQLKEGVLFSLPHPSEVELAEVLTQVVPCCEMVRFFKGGADATTAAVRCARLATGKSLILHHGYHGWHDWWAVTHTRAGIPAEVAGLTVGFNFNDPDSFRAVITEHGARAAAIVLTPAAYGVEPAPGFLELVRQEATRLGIVLVFDEIITGFRWALGGAQEKYGVMPDLAAIGKSMANGMPLSALVGRRELMAPLKDNWVSTTYAGEALAIVASLETIAILQEGRVYPRLYQLAATLNESIARLATEAGVPVTVGATLPAIRFTFPGERAAALAAAHRFVGICAAQGVLVRQERASVTLCLMAALTEADLAQTFEVFAGAFREMERTSSSATTRSPQNR